MKNINFEMKGKKMVIKTDITPIELNTVTGKIEKEMNLYEQQQNVPDTIKQLIYVAVKYGIQLYKKEQEEFSLKADYERKIDELIAKLNLASDQENKLF